MSQCSHFEAIGEHPSCRIGRKAELECGAGCAAYLPDDERQPCEIWSRVMGYHRPVSAWNVGKQAEHRDRTNFKERVR